MPTAEVRGRRWRPVVTLTLCAIGLALSPYTLWVLYHPAALVCVANATFDGQAVLTRAQSVVVGIPVPVFGVAFFVVLGALCLPAAWRSDDPRVHWARLAGVVAGIGMVFSLISTELVTVKRICRWCTGVHVVAFAPSPSW